MQDNPFAGLAKPDESSEPAAVGSTSVEEAKAVEPVSEASSPVVELQKIYVVETVYSPFVLTAKKEETLKLILKNSGADSSSQKTALNEIKELLG
jgi:hypothetical protein